jgi:RNA polymerase sigma factor (sigma-70 family)
MCEAEDLSLVRQINSGETKAVGDAITRLLAKYEKELISCVYRVLKDKNKEEATNIIHDMFMDIFEKGMRNYNSARGTVSAYLLGIAKHKASDYCRKNEKFSQHENIENISAYEDLEKEEKIKSVYDALDSLRLDYPQYAKVLELHFIDSLSYKEIAQISGETVPTIANRLLRARATARSYFDDEVFSTA